MLLHFVYVCRLFTFSFFDVRPLCTKKVNTRLSVQYFLCIVNIDAIDSNGSYFPWDQFLLEIDTFLQVYP